jgi:hypothetical protein
MKSRVATSLTFRRRDDRLRACLAHERRSRHLLTERGLASDRIVELGIRTAGVSRSSAAGWRILARQKKMGSIGLLGVQHPCVAVELEDFPPAQEA